MFNLYGTILTWNSKLLFTKIINRIILCHIFGIIIAAAMNSTLHLPHPLHLCLIFRNCAPACNFHLRDLICWSEQLSYCHPLPPVNCTPPPITLIWDYFTILPYPCMKCNFCRNVWGLEELMGERDKIVRGRRRRRWALEIELLIKYHSAISSSPCCIYEARSPLYIAKDNYSVCSIGTSGDD